MAETTDTPFMRFMITASTVFCALLQLMIFAPAATSTAAESPELSPSIHVDGNGRLVYSANEQGDRIPDFSFAGYGGGGVRLPDVPVKATVESGLGNDAERIQRAIDIVSALTPDGRGIRGAVLLKRGVYHLEKALTVTTGGVVLRGEGQGEDGTVLHGIVTEEARPKFANGRACLVIIAGREGIALNESSRRRITDAYVPVGATSFAVASTAGLKAGDTVIVRRYGNEAWFRELGFDTADSSWSGKPSTHDAERTIAAVDGNRITLDIPIPISIDVRWGGGEIIPFTAPARIGQVGVENLRGDTDFDTSVRSREYGNIDRPHYIGEEYYADERHYAIFIGIDNAANAWVRDCTGIHFSRSVVDIGGGAKWVTVQDCTSLDPVSRSAGGRRFMFSIAGQLCLVQRCNSDKGRHSFVGSGQYTCGPNVFLKCTATRPYGSSEPHSNLVASTLYDNVKAPISLRFARNPQALRWMSINGVLWNCEGMFLVQKPPTAQNFAFGHTGIHAMVFNTALIDHSFEDGHIESWDKRVTPDSLYLQQLRERLGPAAVRNIGYK